MSASQLVEWKTFYELEPDGDERNDWGLAHIVQVLARDGRQLKHFALPFGDTPVIEPVKQPLAYQEMLIDAWCSTNNTIVNKKGAA